MDEHYFTRYVSSVPKETLNPRKQSQNQLNSLASDGYLIVFTLWRALCDGSQELSDGGRSDPWRLA